MSKHGTIACEIGCCPYCADARAIERMERERDEYWRKRFEEATARRKKREGRAELARKPEEEK